RAEFEGLAAWPLEVLHKAGYRIWISSSTDMEANLYTRRLLGTGETVDRFYMAYEPADTMRNVWDNMATDNLVSWIGEMETSEPHYMLYQLDSTHWDYYFDEDAVIAEPYSEIVRPSKLRSQEALDLVYARYLNSARQVDNNLKRVLDALKARGIYENTAIIVVSDHGEGFRVGKVGHSMLQKQTRQIPLIMKLPGVEAFASDAIVSPRDLYPTLHDYLGLTSLPDRFTLGSSVLPPLKGKNVAITFHGTTKQADLTLDSMLFRFDVRFDEDDVTFTPSGVFDHEDQPLLNAEDHLKNAPWREALDSLMPSVKSP
ncbi:MAG: sulfatase-like hydrolase/transferase, partial [Planctomycetota bacterium]|nr:sulfatase-like hydrolase/transferase [Planctomycetota bacterium]